MIVSREECGGNARLASLACRRLGPRSFLHYQKGRHERAMADFNQAIKLDPNFAAAYINRGLILHSKREFNVAFADSKTIRVDPSIVDAIRRSNLRP